MPPKEAIAAASVIISGVLLGGGVSCQDVWEILEVEGGIVNSLLGSTEKSGAAVYI